MAAGQPVQVPLPGGGVVHGRTLLVDLLTVEEGAGRPVVGVVRGVIDTDPGVFLLGWVRLVVGAPGTPRSDG